MGDVRFYCDAKPFELALGIMQRCDRNDRIGSAVDQENWRLGDFPPAPIGSPGQHPGIANYGSHRACAPQSHMERHHGALTEADQRQVGFSQPVLLQLTVDERVDRWCS